MNDEEVKKHFSSPLRRLENNHYAVENAHRRLIKAIEQNHDQEIYAATGEMLLWIMTTHEWHLKHNKGYRKRRSNSEQGRILFGLLHAYNSVKHNMNFIKIHKKAGGFTFPISFPLVIPPITVHWMEAGVILSEGYENQKENYEKYLEGKEVLGTIEQSLVFLNKEKVNLTL